MAEGNIFSVSPAESVNPGLATVYKPLYPEQIALLQQKRQELMDTITCRNIELQPCGESCNPAKINAPSLRIDA